MRIRYIPRGEVLIISINGIPIREQGDKDLATAEGIIIKRLGTALMLYEMAALLRPKREHNQIDLDEPDREGEASNRRRWRALLRIRQEIARRERRAQKITLKATSVAKTNDKPQRAISDHSRSIRHEHTLDG